MKATVQKRSKGSERVGEETWLFPGARTTLVASLSLPPPRIPCGMQRGAQGRSLPWALDYRDKRLPPTVFRVLRQEVDLNLHCLKSQQVRRC